MLFEMALRAGDLNPLECGIAPLCGKLISSSSNMLPGIVESVGDLKSNSFLPPFTMKETAAATGRTTRLHAEFIGERDPIYPSPPLERDLGPCLKMLILQRSAQIFGRATSVSPRRRPDIGDRRATYSIVGNAVDEHQVVAAPPSRASLPRSAGRRRRIRPDPIPGCRYHAVHVSWTRLLPFAVSKRRSGSSQAESRWALARLHDRAISDVRRSPQTDRCRELTFGTIPLSRIAAIHTAVVDRHRQRLPFIDLHETLSVGETNIRLRSIHQ